MGFTGPTGVPARLAAMSEVMGFGFGRLGAELERYGHADFTIQKLQAASVDPEEEDAVFLATTQEDVVVDVGFLPPYSSPLSGLTYFLYAKFGGYKVFLLEVCNG